MHRLVKEQHLKISLDDAWDFFSNPANLKTITPDHMGFDITSPIDEEIYEGMIITYEVTPMLNLPLKWMTEISHVKKPFYFVDNQLYGPYKVWHHQHHFTQTDQGVLMQDIVNYVVPLRGIGSLLDRWYIRNQVENIFNHRYKILDKHFNR